MRAHIKKLQAKSEGTRKQILIGSVIICMSLVVFIWVSSLGHKFNKENTVKTQEEIKPFALFGQTISDTYKSVTSSVSDISSPKKEEPKVEVNTDNEINLNPIEFSN